MATKFHQRPGSTRTDTDKVSRESEQPTPSLLRDSEKTYDRKPDINYDRDELPAFDAAKEDHFGEATVLTDAKDVLTHVIHVDDDPSLSPWTFRALVLVLENPDMDPHYKLIVQSGYSEVPNWWYGMVLLTSFVVGLDTLYGIQSTLPWWGYIILNLFALLFILFFGAQMGLTGFQFNQQPIIQMVAGYIHPGKPLANMYFTVFGFNGVQQGQWLCRDLKIAQLVHFCPKSTFTAQMTGAVIGAIFNYIMMKTIVTNQFKILTSIESSNIWSGQNVQQYNTLAIAWSIAGDMFSIGARYTKIEFFKLINLSIIFWYMGWLFVGVNSSILSYFAIGFFAQFYLRKYKPALFVKYNYLVSAALDGGTQAIVFILSFAVFGGGSVTHDFPLWR